ncbi:MAG: 50S ribosomal protein L21 [Candidatus Azobacteroides pseudotrichonymphae]|jgi:large subunit ribosomal protein L21|uniref:Large ribosomal subunit protein bL21 n=1 Tax=Azobacteroides pseudotrichonymphae genomovar. CFP2 TaxID=511995 RepID=RL21_AZOPC|nr:50S ribosomal protein L21 [Candidatus Azobacteroides pseudotrichonymphae]B6YRH7.1 RecName: Full=Large ribosomal subunit protein bL21; AltName: Full=50S ribosomal protein L21 [Candidatus Azobacteroides pseudotrichonymphae genomovar. CFP2]MDR0530198.1 50S ribosomal protein L21 [Bacteroidales bacterium OttesenSCG-928-I14]BAG83799.1 50S ribosomal protein L21 [Candidatus Azobacteroides pseudotrichonymphae genomovar. CFP2]GMO35423.1 MAG: 50S ribosomal protein L21 [Candidatus Azobacteroides pseudot
MYAIVEIQGQQFKVEKDQKLYVNHFEAKEGVPIIFNKVLLVDNDGFITIGNPLIKGAKVEVSILRSLVKGDKILVFHKKRRKGYRKLNGHRQQFSQILIRNILI